MIQRRSFAATAEEPCIRVAGNGFTLDVFEAKQ